MTGTLLSADLPAAPSAAELRARFDSTSHGTVGIEEELMLLHPRTLDLHEGSAEAISAVAGDARYRRELPAAQLEIVTPPGVGVPEAAGFLATARNDLAVATEGEMRLATAGTHPFAAPIGGVSEGERYRRILEEYGWVAVRELVFGMHVHVAVQGADRALAVYNSLRCYLPEIAALAGNAPFWDGADTGLASIRPKIAEALPRQGIPPRFATWEDFAEFLAWGRRSSSFPDAKHLWWELRLHSAHGTLELRGPDAQSSVEDAAGVAAFIQALVMWLCAEWDAGMPMLAAPGLRIAENRWRALRHGLDGRLVDLESGEQVPTRERLGELMKQLRPTAARLGAATEFAHAEAMLAQSGSERQRQIADERGLQGLVGWLADRYSAHT